MDNNQNDDFREFLITVKKARTKKKFRISKSYNYRSFYRYFNSHKQESPYTSKYIVNETVYTNIISTFNRYLMDEMLYNKRVIKFPFAMGKIYLNHYKAEPTLDENGNMKFNSPIDWSSTLKWWYECPEAKEKKLVLKYKPGIKYKVTYKKGKFKNSYFISFVPSRMLRKKVKPMQNPL